MQYKVPQNVQREDKIIGPLTLKQMGILALGGGIAYATFVSLEKTYTSVVWAPPVAILVLTTVTFAFIKPYGLEFYQVLMNLIEYKILAKKRIWIQGAGSPFIAPAIENQTKKITEHKTEKPENKKRKSIEELSKMLDNKNKYTALNINQKESTINKTEKINKNTHKTQQ